MKQFSLAAMFALALLTTTNCTGKQANNNAQDTDTVAVSVEEAAPAANYYGTYEGTLPCADCSGIKTVLTLKGDTTYDLSQEYLDKKDGKFAESGTYTVENGLVTLITPSSGDKTYYKILEGKVALTDSTGTMAEGVLADKYILTKK